MNMASFESFRRVDVYGFAMVMWETLRRCMTHDGVEVIVIIMMMMTMMMGMGTMVLMMLMAIMAIIIKFLSLVRTLPCLSTTWSSQIRALRICTRYFEHT